MVHIKNIFKKNEITSFTATWMDGPRDDLTKGSKIKTNI